MRTAPRAIWLSMMGAGAAVACNLVLGIDERSRSTPSMDAGPPETGVDAAPPGPIERCAKDSDCVPPNGCYTPRCDRALGACTYALCDEPGRTCSIGVCNEATFTCGDFKTYGFRTGGYPIPNVTLACATMADGCAAAIFPFLFLGTATGVIALRIDNVVAAAPTVVPIGGADIGPQQLVVSGRRLWIVGQVQGTEAPYRLPLATIDVPPDPFVTELHAEVASLAYPYAKVAAFPATGEGLFLTLNEPTEGLPTAVVRVPLSPSGELGVVNPLDAAPPMTPPSHPMVSIGAPPGSAVVASTGERLLLYRPQATFNLVTKPGAPGATAGPDLALSPAPPTLARPRFSEGGGGVVTMSEPIAADAGDCNCWSRQRVQWVMGGESATVLETNVLADPESFMNPWNTLLACGSCTPPEPFATPSLSTWIDETTILLASPASDPIENRAATVVRVVKRDPVLAPAQQRVVTLPSEKPSGDFLVDRIALTSSNGLGFLVIADNQGNNVKISTFDPHCNAN